MDIHGKKALVLGATREIGLAVARRLADCGMHLILPWYDWPESVQSLQQEFGTPEKRHLIMQADLRKEDDVALLLAETKRQFGALDVLVNNIERGGMPVLHGSYHRQVNHGQWQRELDTTLLAKWLVWQQSLPLLQKAPEAAVVNISSIAGLVGRGGPASLLFNDAYAAANRGVSSFTELWAREGAPSIRVNELMLGLIDHRHGPGTRGWEALSCKEKEQLRAHTLLRRTGSPGEVAQAVLFLIRDADYLTGALIRMDGGYLLGGEEVLPMPHGILE